MPQVILECSDNVVEKNLKETLFDIHLILVKMLPTELESCKGRILRHQDYVLGDGNKNNAFVHVGIEVLKGRETILLDEIGETIVEKLKTAFRGSLDLLKLQITVSIRNLPDVYCKYTQTN